MADARPRWSTVSPSSGGSQRAFFCIRPCQRLSEAIAAAVDRSNEAHRTSGKATARPTPRAEAVRADLTPVSVFPTCPPHAPLRKRLNLPRGTAPDEIERLLVGAREGEVLNLTGRWNGAQVLSLRDTSSSPQRPSLVARSQQGHCSGHMAALRSTRCPFEPLAIPQRPLQ